MDGRLEIWQIVYCNYFRMVFLLDDALADIFICLSEELRTNLENLLVKLERSGLSFFVRCLYSAAPMAFPCYLQFLRENTNFLENPNGFFYVQIIKVDIRV